MEFRNLKCGNISSNGSTCFISSVEYITFDAICFFLILIISVISTFFNFIDCFILTFFKNMSSKFFQLLKFNSYNNLFISINDFIMMMLYFSTNKHVYKYNGVIYYANESFLFMGHLHGPFVHASKT